MLRGGITFEVRYPDFKPGVIEAMKEAKRISRDPNIKGYTSMEKLFEELDK